jgi:poly-gamma-glutamate capsule biosynthesis protein CapA/YwtB (metallophosphatase superfamily)
VGRATPEHLAARRAARRRAVHLRRGLAAGCLVAASAGLAAAVLVDPPAPVSAAVAPRETEAVVAPAATTAVVIAAVGDITMGDIPVLPPDGGVSLFASVRPALAGDVVLGNLETALTTRGSGQCRSEARNCFDFRVPPAYARHLRQARFSVLNLANNHAWDFGATGQADTLAALDRRGLLHTGRPGEIAYQEVGDTVVAVIGFAPYSWAQSLLDARAAARLVRTADARADVVVVTFHGGAEGSGQDHVPNGPEVFLGERRGDLRAFAHAVVDAGADLVAGHGPHVLRGLEWYRGRLVAYSLGNFSAYKNFNLSGPGSVSAVLRVTLGPDGSFTAGRLVPLRLVGHGTPVPDPERAALAAVRSLSRSDFGPRAVRIGPRGELRVQEGKELE